MAIGVFGALLYVAHKFERPDALILVALYFIVLQFLIICALALLFSSFSSPLLSAVFAFSLFVIGNVCRRPPGFAGMAARPGALARHGGGVPGPEFLGVQRDQLHRPRTAGRRTTHLPQHALRRRLPAMALSGAVLIFERRNLK